MKHGIICGKVCGKNLNAFGTQLGSLLNPFIKEITITENTDDNFTISAKVYYKDPVTPVLHYGLTTDFGSTVNATEGEISGLNTVTFNVTGVTHYTIYHYKIVLGELSSSNRYIVPATDVVIGEQTWGSKNSNIKTTPFGTVIPEVVDNTEWSNLTTPGWCYPKLEAANEEVYGLIYNGAALKKIQEDIDNYNAANPDAPFPYDVADEFDYETLIVAYGGTDLAGRHLKEDGTEHWTQDIADNSSGWTGLPGSYRLGSGTTGGLGLYGLWRYLDSVNGLLLRQNNDDAANITSVLGTGDQKGGTSLRFIKRTDRIAPEFKPQIETFDIVNVETTKKVLFIDENDNLYGTNGFRDVIKANELDLTDSFSVCQLPSNSMLKKLLFVSETKAVGFVQDGVTPANNGFYCFDNANTNSWTARKVDTMLAGVPGFEFQSFVATPNKSHLFASSYGTKDTDPAPINVYRSTDLGETWDVVYTHHVTANSHVHAIEWDTYINRLWVAIGDEGTGGAPGWAYSDDYGDTFSFVENNDASGQIPFMDTAIIPLPDATLFGSDYTPAGVRIWKPTAKTAGVAVSNADVSVQRYLTNRFAIDNLGFAKKPLVDLSSTPYKIVLPFSYNAAYSNAQLLISPDAKNWFNIENVSDPSTELSFEAISGMTSNGYVMGWSTYTGVHYHRYFKFPNWVKNDNH